MKNTSSVIGKLNKKVEMVFSDDYCDKHNSKKVRKMVYEGEHFCPMCFTEKLNKELQIKVTRDVIKDKINRKYNYLKEKSLVADVELFSSTIENYFLYCEETARNRNKVIDLIKRINRGENLSVWFSGNTGVGKSHLAMAMLKNLNDFSMKQAKRDLKEKPFVEVLDNMKTCLFVNTNMLMDSIRESFNDKTVITTPKFMIDRLINVDYLVLDDIGSEVGSIDTNKSASDFVTRVIYAIVTGRQNKTTIYTTNLSSKMLRSIYDEKAYSRMSKNAETIVYKTAKDQRGGYLGF